jgi:hypothetical protein
MTENFGIKIRTKLTIEDHFPAGIWFFNRRLLRQKKPFSPHINIIPQIICPKPIFHYFCTLKTGGYP